MSCWWSRLPEADAAIVGLGSYGGALARDCTLDGAASWSRPMAVGR
jgi:hypothetical protein